MALLRSVIGTLVLFRFVASPAFADTGFLDRQVTVRGQTYRYQVFVPPAFTPSIQWPILIDLHGNGAQGDDGIRQTAHMLGEHIRVNRGRFPFVTVFPQASAGSNWLDPLMQEIVIAETERTVSEFNGDAAGIYVGGFSMGATDSRPSWRSQA